MSAYPCRYEIPGRLICVLDLCALVGARMGRWYEFVLELVEDSFAVVIVGIVR